MNELALSAPRMSPARLVVDYNPFYLLSGMCMLAGLFALNNWLTWSPLAVRNVLGLILVLNLYEFLLIGLGVFLARRGHFRDAGMLFVLEAFFLVDAGFLNAEVFSLNFELGLIINTILFALAAAKVAAVFSGLGLSPGDGRMALVLAQLLILLALPGLFKHAAEAYRGGVSPLTCYGAWWIVGIIPVVYLILLRDLHDPRHRTIIGTFAALPIVSILAHLCAVNWVYDVRWNSANLSPLLLGLAAAIGASDHHVRTLAARMRLQLLLPALAILLAMPDRYSLIWLIGDIPMTPLRATLLGAAAVYLHGQVIPAMAK